MGSRNLGQTVLQILSLAFQFGQWVVIQHAQFDLSHESGPYHSTQVLFNGDSKEYIIRVWGRAYKNGSVSGAAEVEELLQSSLGPKTLCCPGHLSPGQNNLSALFSNIPSFALHTHPFDRWVSTRCKVLHMDTGRGER